MNNELVNGFGYIGLATNNESEYYGLMEGLEQAKALNASHIKIRGDSQLVINQIKDIYNVYAITLMPYYQKIKSLLKSFKSYDIQHVYRHENELADQLAKQAIQNKNSRTICNWDNIIIFSD